MVHVETNIIIIDCLARNILTIKNVSKQNICKAFDMNFRHKGIKGNLATMVFDILAESLIWVNGYLRQYFSNIWSFSGRKEEEQSRIGPCLTIIKISRTPQQ